MFLFKRYARVVEDSGRRGLRTLLGVKPEGGPPVLCEYGSATAREALGEFHDRQKALAERLDNLFALNEAYLNGETDAPAPARATIPGDEVRTLLRRVAGGDVPLGVALDWLNDMRQQGRIGNDTLGGGE